jgi:hypothetical protein
MPSSAELQALRRQLDELAEQPDDALTRRYTLALPPLPPGVHWRLRRIAARAVRRLQAALRRPNPWPAALRHAPGARATPLLIWAMGADRSSVRAACRRLAEVREALPGFAPVLVTDVADFAVYSRLGWLVEFVPEIAGEGASYRERKMRFLARLYRGAPALPVSAGMELTADEILQWAKNAATIETRPLPP